MVVLGLGMPRTRGDVLVGTNGERFIGTVIEENSTNVVFDSELAGRLVFPRTRIRELQAAAKPESPPLAAAAVTNAPVNRLAWKPPGVGADGADWVQLKSGEWLRGQLNYVQNKEVEFDSDEMELQLLKLKDVRQLYTTHRVFTQFDNQPAAYGRVVISNEVVTVTGEAPLSESRNRLIGITPSGGKTGIRNWSGNLSAALSLQSGNTHQVNLTTTAELARRTPSTTLLLDYLGNYGKSDGVQSANNNRFNSTWDIRIGRDWFFRPLQFEYYQDSLANIDYRLTDGVGGGYYIFDRTGLEWTVSAGPSYQYTKFSTVEAGQSDTSTTPAGLLESKFKQDITSRLTFIQAWQSIFTSQAAGQYTHHTVSTLEFEIKRHLDLDVSFIWDYLNHPQVKSNGTLPDKNDLYLTVGLGVRF